MPDYRYLVVGGGMTGDAACKGIRSIDPVGSIGLVGDEPDPPYARPPLTKGLWLGKEEGSIWRGTVDHGVELHLGRTIVSLDLEARTAADSDGDVYGYERLLLATGGRPREMPGAADGVVYFRTLADYRALRAGATPGARVLVVGGGFIGSEIAAALSCERLQRHDDVPRGGDRLRGSSRRPRARRHRLLPRARGRDREQDARCSPSSATASGFTSRPRPVRPSRRTRWWRASASCPATTSPRRRGLPAENGIAVDDRGRVGSREDVFAAGDVARFPARDLGREIRIEHEDHAKSHGHQVGRNMAGADEAYDHLPFFYSDMFDLGYEAVGELDARLDTVAEWAEPHRKGVVCYRDAEGRPRGFLLWDVWGKVDAARELIRAGSPVGPAQLGELLA